MNYKIRKILEGEVSLLQDFLYEAIWLSLCKELSCFPTNFFLFFDHILTFGFYNESRIKNYSLEMNSPEEIIEGFTSTFYPTNKTKIKSYQK